MSEMDPTFQRILDSQVIPYETLSNLERCAHCNRYEEADELIWEDGRPYHTTCPRPYQIVDADELTND